MTVPGEDASPPCPGCGEHNPATSRFCSSCGSALTISCSACGATVTGRFCSQCGTPLAAGTAAGSGPVTSPPPAVVAERRLTSVLFGDLVGFTPLSESRDAEEVRALLSRYFTVARTIVQRYGGTVEKFIGDAVMAVWGVPVAREDDAERAVRAGLDLVDAITALGDEIGARDLALRVGITTGETAATIGADGEGMVAGDVVNTAARIQSVAAPGEVWVDVTTRSLTAAAVAYADAGTHALKGKTHPLTLSAARHVVAAVGGAQRVDGLEAPFIGRDREMRLVKELFHATLEEGRPRLVDVSGVPGVGKSRLGWEFFKYVDGISGRVRWHRGRCLAYGDGVAFWALAEMVRSRIDAVEGDDQIMVEHKLRRALDRWVHDAEERAWLLPRMATLLGVADAVAPGAAFARDDLFASWQLFFERLVTDGAEGVALLVEDLQWADDGLLDFLEQVLVRSQAPIFILTLSRPDLSERRAGWAGGRRATPLYLEPLADAAMSAVVDGLVDGLPEQVRTSLVVRAEGIPLYAVETVRSLIDRDLVIPREGRYVLAGAIDAQIDAITDAAPTSLHTLLAARLDALTETERQTVQNAAVLGLSFTRRALDALASATGGVHDIDATLAGLVRKEILALESDPRSPERGQYRFVQAMVRSVAYDTLSKRDRKARHLLAAEHLANEPDAESFAAVLADHLIEARAAAPDDTDADELGHRAVQLLEQAAGRADALGSPAQAIKHLHLALSLVADPVDVGRLCARAAASASVAARTAEAEELSARAAAAFEAANLPIERADAIGQLNYARMLTGAGEDVPELLTPLYDELVTVPGSEATRARLARIIGRAYFAHRSDAVSSWPWWERAIELAEDAEEWAVLANALGNYGASLLARGRATFGLGVLRLALEVAREHDLLDAQLIPLNNLASFLAARDIVAAVGYVDQGLELARKLGDRAAGSYLVNTGLLVHWIAGNWDTAVRLVDEIDDASAVYVMGIAYAHAIAAARGDAPEVPALDSGSTAPQVSAPTLLMRAWADMQRGDNTAALAAAEEALRIYHSFAGHDDDFPLFWTGAFELAISVGEVDRATQVLRLVSDGERRKLPPLLRALVPYFQARLATLTGADAVSTDADFTESENALRSFGAAYWLSRCLLDHAEWLVGRGHPDEAIALLDEAKSGFRLVAAPRLLARAERIGVTQVVSTGT